MKCKAAVALLVSIVFLTSCGPGWNFTPQIEQGEAIPEGKVLMIGKFVIDPVWLTEKEKAKSGQEKLDILVGTTNDLSQPVKEGSLYSPDGSFNPVLHEVFYYPVPAGTQYIRSGIVQKVVGQHYVGIAKGSPIFENLNFFRNIKLTVPTGAKAVYVGTIIYYHDGKHATSIVVRDDYEQALKELVKKKIPGIKPSDVKKQLAVVVK